MGYKRDNDMKYHGLYKEDINGSNTEETLAKTLFTFGAVIFTPLLLLMFSVVLSHLTQ